MAALDRKFLKALHDLICNKQRTLNTSNNKSKKCALSLRRLMSPMQCSNHSNLDSYQAENSKCNSIIPTPSTPTSEHFQHRPTNPTTSSLHTKDSDTAADTVVGVVNKAVVGAAVVEAKLMNANTVGRTACAITMDKSVTSLPMFTSRTPLWKTVWVAIIRTHDGVG